MKTAIQILHYSDRKGQIKASTWCLVITLCTVMFCYCGYMTADKAIYTMLAHKRAMKVSATFQLAPETFEWLAQLRRELLEMSLIYAVVTLAIVFVWRNLPSMVLIYAQPQLGDVISADHGQTLGEAMRRIRYEPAEFLCIFNPRTRQKVIELTMLDPTKVEIDADRLQEICAIGGAIQLHNHPVANAPFSGADFEAAISCRASMSLVISGPTVYVLTLTEECWELNSREVEVFYEERLKQFKETKAHRTSIGGIIQVTDYGTSVLDACIATAKRYDLGFVSMPYREAMKRFCV